MTPEEATALRNKIDNSAGLKSLEHNLSSELMLQEERFQYGIDPFTILFIISVILQVVSICINSRSKADVEMDMANVSLLPPRKLMRLKRRLNTLWAEHCSKNGIEPGKTNPFFNAAINAVKSCQRTDIAGIVESSN